MKNLRTTTIAFTVFWLAILTIFSFGSNYANRIVVYSLLAALVSLKSTYLIRQDGARSVASALAYAGALTFGAVGGLVVGLAAGIGYGAEGRGRRTDKRMRLTAVQSGVAGFAAGLTHTHVLEILKPGLIPQAIGILGPAAVCFAIFVLFNLLANKRYTWPSAKRRTLRYGPLAMEFGVGVAIAAATRTLYGLFAWESMFLVMPIAYLAKQSYSELLSDERRRVNKKVRRKMVDLYLATIESLVTAIDAKDRFKCYHTKGVEHLAVAIAQQMDLSPNEIEGIRMAALLHDVGNLGVPEHVLQKPGKLDAQEFAKIQAHPTLGQKIVDNVNFPWPVEAIVRSHHERWDGTGYPDGLKGEEIPLGARILTVADVYRAMTSKRPHRPGKTPEQAIDYIKTAAGSHFDPESVRVFEEVIEEGHLHPVDQQAAQADVNVQSEMQTPHPERQPSSENTIANDISRASDEFLAMFEIAQTASTTLNLAEVLSLLANKIRNMISCSTCVIFLRDEESDRLRAKIAVGANDRYFEGGHTLVGHGLTGVAAETAEGVIADYDRNDVMLRQLFGQWIELRTVMIVPIMHGNAVIGTINLYDTKNDAFSSGDFSLLNTVAPQVGKAIQNALLFEQTKESALTDPLTGLHNARYLFMHLEQELSRAKRSMQYVSVLGLDLDNFKLINDTFGHQQGDLVLQEIGQLFISQVRDYDLVCRYAGDEFIIIQPNTNKAEAIETAERIKAAVDQYVPALHHEEPIRLGVSIGVAIYPEDGQDVRTLISQADARMYTDKRQRQSKDEQAA